jgi:hypothetical protein
MPYNQPQPITQAANSQRNNIASALMQIARPPPQLPGTQLSGAMGGQGPIPQLPQAMPPGAPPQGAPTPGMPPPAMPLTGAAPPQPMQMATGTPQGMPAMPQGMPANPQNILPGAMPPPQNY